MSDPFFKYWGRSPMPIGQTRVENNYYAPCYTPMRGNCHHRGSSLWNIMAMLGIINNMQNQQYFPTQYPMYPDLYLNNQNDMYLEQQTLQNDANDLAICQQLFGSEYYIAPPLSNGTYIARSKDGKTIIQANSPGDLIDKLQKQVSTNS